jgi:hypothetical protein
VLVARFQMPNLEKLFASRGEKNYHPIARPGPGGSKIRECTRTSTAQFLDGILPFWYFATSDAFSLLS